MRPLRFAIALLPLALCVTFGASAAIYKCVDADGAVTYAGMPCPKEDFIALVLVPPPVAQALPTPTRADAAASRTPAREEHRGSARAGPRDRVTRPDRGRVTNRPDDGSGLPG